MNNIKERIKIFSGGAAKYIAFLSMLIESHKQSVNLSDFGWRIIESVE